MRKTLLAGFHWNFNVLAPFRPILKFCEVASAMPEPAVQYAVGAMEIPLNHRGIGMWDRVCPVLIGLITALICGIMIYAAFFHLII